MVKLSYLAMQIPLGHLKKQVNIDIVRKGKYLYTIRDAWFLKEVSFATMHTEIMEN